MKIHDITRRTVVENTFTDQLVSRITGGQVTQDIPVDKRNYKQQTQQLVKSYTDLFMQKFNEQAKAITAKFGDLNKSANARKELGDTMLKYLDTILHQTPEEIETVLNSDEWKAIEANDTDLQGTKQKFTGIRKTISDLLFAETFDVANDRLATGLNEAWDPNDPDNAKLTKDLTAAVSKYFSLVLDILKFTSLFKSQRDLGSKQTPPATQDVQGVFDDIKDATTKSNLLALFRGNEDKIPAKTGIPAVDEFVKSLKSKVDQQQKQILQQPQQRPQQKLPNTI